MSKPTDQNNQNTAPKTAEKKKINYSATYTPMWSMFAEMIDDPPFVTHSQETDHLDAQRIYLGIDTSAERDEEAKKFEAINAAIKETQKKQIAYILRTLCDHCDRPVEDADKYLADDVQMTGALFTQAIRELRTRVDKEGNVLNTEGTVLNREKMGRPFMYNQRVGMIEDPEIAKIISDSTLEENIGPGEPEYEDMRREDAGSSKRMEKYKNAIGKHVASRGGFPLEKLEDKFKSCLISDDSPSYWEVDYDELQQAKMEFIRDEMMARDPVDRTEQAFVTISEQLDVSLRSTFFPNQKIRSLDEEKAFKTLPSKEAYEKFAIETMSPVGAAKGVESKFNSYIDDATSRNENIKLHTCAAYIHHLQEIHAKRPFWTRFTDWFKKDGENSTINRMKERLNRTFGKEDVEDALEDCTTPYPENGYAKRYKQVAVEKHPPVYEEASLGVDWELTKVDQAYKASNGLKEAIANTENQKQAEADAFARHAEQQRKKVEEAVKLHNERTSANKPTETETEATATK